MTHLPRILRETSEGVTPLTLADAAFERREIYLTGEINSETANAVIWQLMQLQAQDAGKEIVLYITSPGGEVQSGLSIVDAMKGISCPVRTVCMGVCASMAAVIFASGNERDILPHSKVMIHDPLTPGMGGSALSVQEMSNRLMETRREVCKILADCCGKSLKEIYRKTAKDTWFTAKEAVTFGLADRVINRLERRSA